MFFLCKYFILKVVFMVMMSFLRRLIVLDELINKILDIWIFCKISIIFNDCKFFYLFFFCKNCFKDSLIMNLVIVVRELLGLL